MRTMTTTMSLAASAGRILLLLITLTSILHASELDALIEFYNATSGSQWLRSDQWLDGNDYCQWFGMVCHPNGLVRGISLPNNNLAGTVPSSLYIQLSELTALDLQQNSITEAGFDGLAPQLQTLNLRDCLLEAVQGLEKLSHLRELDLSRNSLRSTVPTELQALTALQVLSVAQCELTGPVSIASSWNELRSLDVSHNKLTGPLPPIQSLTSLVYLNLAFNEWNGTLWWTDLPPLIRELQLEGETLETGEVPYPLTGPLPSSWNTVRTLRTLNLAHNALTGTVPPNFLQSVQPPVDDETPVVLLLAYNQLQGTLPEFWIHWPRLDVTVSHNRITEMPDSYCQQDWWNQGTVGLFGCNAIACPPGLYNWAGRQTSAENACMPCMGDDTTDTSLQVWGATECEYAVLPTATLLIEFYQALNGPHWERREGWDTLSETTTATDICRLHGVICNAQGQVAIINLPGNRLEGTIPTSIFQLPSLSSFDVSRNFVDLASFQALTRARQLTRLFLSSTQIFSVEGISNAKGLVLLSLDGNALKGSLPIEMYQLTKLTELHLEACFFSGQIPSGLSKLSALKRLFLHQNRFTGQLPGEIAVLSHLEELDLSFNSFAGTLPGQWNGLTSLSKLRLTNGKGTLGGRLIPFSGLLNIEELDLSNNLFNTTVPSDLLSGRSRGGTLRVALAANDLTGAVPSELSSFDKLILELQDNQISALPIELCQQDDWMDGEVGLVPNRCDAILCPLGTWSPFGRASVRSNIMCEACDTASGFYGTTKCVGSVGERNMETEILDKLYTDTFGKYWFKPSSNWTKPGVPICYREGVSCAKTSPDMNSVVVEVYLNGYGLNGKVPPEIFNLPYVRELGFSFNNIDISLANIGSAKDLQILLLSGTHIQSLDGIENAGSNLIILHAAKNGLRGPFPPELLYLKTLKELYISENRLSSTIPLEISRMSGLTVAQLDQNRFVGFLPELGALSSLKSFSAARNLLSGTLPASLSALPLLETLDLSGQLSLKKLSGPILAFDRNPKLRSIDLSQNYLEGSIPDTFLRAASQSDALKVNLSSNELAGTVPLTLDAFQQLTIDLTSNMIKALPSSLCDNAGWMNGAVGLVPREHSCDAILCRPGTAAPSGRQMFANDPCVLCESEEQAPYFGSTRCKDPFTADTPCSGVLLPIDGGTICATSTSERSTLELLFASTWGGGWKNKTRWMTDAPICGWDGILCAGEPQDDFGVVSISLDYNGLSGDIQAPVFALPLLRGLNLEGNTDLAVSLSLISGSSRLEKLLLSGVQLMSLHGVANAKNLKELSFSGLRGSMPEDLFALKYLERLDISNNHFVGTIGPGVKAWGALRSFVATGNDFHGQVPREMCQIMSLEDIVIDENLLSGGLPGDELSAMSNLKFFSITRQQKSGRRLEGPLPPFDKTPMLESIRLANNELSSSIPSNFVSSVGASIVIDLSNNLIEGTMPVGLDRVSGLTIFLSENEITNVPVGLCDNSDWMFGASGEIGSCDAILCAPGYWNRLGHEVASLPCEQCPLSADPYFGRTSCETKMDERQVLIEFFEACGGVNWYRSDFWASSTDICDWYGVGCYDGRVVVLSLESNNVAGVTPSSVFELRHLQVLNLSSNPVKVDFTRIGKAENLRELRLALTQQSSLSGISNAIGLNVLDVSFSNLGGAIPTELFHLFNLRVLALRGNSLQGAVSDSWSQLEYLRILRLDDNELSGSLPSLSQFGYLDLISLAGNSFHGPLTSDLLGRASVFRPLTVDLSNNQLTGAVPAELARFSSLTLYLRNNQITEIPDALCSMTDWNGGDVGRFGCSAILCPSGTSNTIGRQSRSFSDCTQCLNGSSYLGQTQCGNPSGTSSTRSVWSVVMCIAISLIWA